MLALTCALLTPVLHLIVLTGSHLDPAATHISELTHTPLGDLHTIALLLFGGAQLVLGLALGSLDHGRLWPAARILLKGSGIAVAWIAYRYHQLGPEVDASVISDPLWIVASLVGVAMGCLLPGLSRIAPGLARFNGACLMVWVLLIPLAAFTDEALIGAYERLVGSIYAVWVAGLCVGLLRLKAQPSQWSSAP